MLTLEDGWKKSHQGIQEPLWRWPPGSARGSGQIFWVTLPAAASLDSCTEPWAQSSARSSVARSGRFRWYRAALRSRLPSAHRNDLDGCHWPLLSALKPWKWKLALHHSTWVPTHLYAPQGPAIPQVNQRLFILQSSAWHLFSALLSYLPGSQQQAFFLRSNW